MPSRVVGSEPAMVLKLWSSTTISPAPRSASRAPRSRLWVTEGTVEKHVRSILAKLSRPETDDDHRRVLAVVTFLEAR